MTTLETPILTTHLFVSSKEAFDGLKDMVVRLVNSGISVKLYEAEDELLDKNPKLPRVYLSVGQEWQEFSTLLTLPYQEKKRWLHYNTPEEIQPFMIYNCWLKGTEPLPVNRAIPQNQFTSDTPLVSVFTASYRSKDKISRPYQSLLNQTYTNWEWVIVDDSGDEDETYNNYLRALNDPRVRRYRQDSRNGYIGAVKRYAAGLCTGEILVEVDHDDELTPDCLQKIVDAFKEHPDCGFAFGDCTEVYYGSNNAHWYGWDCGYGYSIYYRVWVHEMNRWQNVHKHTSINADTVRHLVGLPNHPRAWTRDCYHLIGGHREELMVGDDYDMIIRTFLCTKMVVIPDLVYIQYRNEQGDNSTFKRNQQIQTLIKELYQYYYPRISDRLQELNLPGLLPYHRIWETNEDYPGRKTAHVVNERSSKISYLYPIPYSDEEYDCTQLYKSIQDGMATNFIDSEVVVIGNIPPEVEFFASKAPMGAIRWWPMEPSDSLETCISYGKYIASCKEKMVILPGSLLMQ
jgi:O-antigen biosynthesis protein